MKKILKLIFALILSVSLVACGGGGSNEATTDTTDETSEDVYNVVYLVNGNLGDKSFFDSAQSGLTELESQGRITLKTIELGASDSDKPKWESVMYEVSDSGEYDFVVLGTFEMADYLKNVATDYPEQKYIIFDDDSYVGENENVLNITYKQNELGYIIGVLAGSITTDTSVEHINEEPVIGFIGGIDCPPINDFLIGYIEGAQSVNPDIKVDTRYTNDYVDTANAKEFALSMMNDKKVDVIWGVAGNAGNGAAEAILETDNAWFIGVDSDQEATFQEELAAITLTSGLKNIGNSLVWVFDELDAGNEYWGTHVILSLADGGVGIVTDKNYDAIVSDEIKATVEEAIKSVQDGTVKVSTALGPDAIDVPAIRDSIRP
ncbi:MAG: BMP family ABC transporter substrate-binding protein [Erysipelotrichaceae bacterium]|jgi:basic membrane protein A|nr:BMP family ABC transporter substrate-binding protein [Erysipelotrichaceae bacterium]